MARAFSSISRTFIDLPDSRNVALGSDIVWLDLLYPTAEDESNYEQLLGLDLPMREEMKSIEPSSRLYRESDALFLTATLTAGADTYMPVSTPVSFILKGNLLVTIRYDEPRAFAVFAGHLVRHAADYPDGRSVLCGLLEAIVERSAEVLEKINADADAISQSIFADETGVKDSGVHERTLRRIAYLQNLTNKIRDSLVTLGRLTHYSGLVEAVRSDAVLESQLRSVEQDTRSLGDQASFLSSSIGFLLNASLGLINIEQNGIIKFFSVVAVIFLPPTLIASIYGMNFGAMPELHWHLGYPLALSLMLCSAIGPYTWFKYKRWF